LDLSRVSKVLKTLHGFLLDRRPNLLYAKNSF